MVPYLPISILDMGEQREIAVILHYVFAFVDPAYCVFGGIYFIDRVSSISWLVLKHRCSKTVACVTRDM